MNSILSSINLDKMNKVPVYYQLNEQISEKIKSGTLRPGDRLPSESEMCEYFNLSRGTIREGIDMLVKDGYVTRERGKGTFIKAPTLNYDIIGDYSLGYGIKRIGLKCSSIVLESEIIAGKNRIIKRLRLHSKASLFRLYRVRCASGEPWIIEDCYIPAEYFKGIEQFDYTQQLVADTLLEKYHTRLSRIDCYIEPTTLVKEQADLMHVNQGIPALAMDRVVYDQDNRAVLYSTSVVRGDRCRYYFNIKR